MTVGIHKSCRVCIEPVINFCLLEILDTADLKSKVHHRMQHLLVLLLNLSSSTLIRGKSTDMCGSVRAGAN